MSSKFPRSNIRFGQRPRPEASVSPHTGRIGTTFYFNAIKFDPDCAVSVKVVAPTGKTVFERSVTADQTGSIGYLRLSWSSANSVGGEYNLNATGSRAGASASVTATFTLT